jgi:gluconolactonase
VVYEWSEASGVREFLKPSGYTGTKPRGGEPGSNGLARNSAGRLVLMQHGDRRVSELISLNGSRSFEPLASDFEGKKFNSPNDMVYGPDGTLWFTDPPFSLPGFSARDANASVPPAKQLPYNAVFRYKDGKLAPVITDMFTPNGIGMSPDGKTLYVDNTLPDAYIRAYDIAGDGSLSNKRDLYRFESNGDFRQGVPDGLKVDSKGNIWMTGPGGINIISPNGKLLGRIQLPFRASNIAFGEDLHSVYFAAGSTIFRLRTLVAGGKPMYYRQ